MKPHRPVTLGMVGVCIANVGIATMEAAFGKTKDPLARLPPAAALSHTALVGVEHDDYDGGQQHGDWHAASARIARAAADQAAVSADPGICQDSPVIKDSRERTAGAGRAKVAPPVPACASALRMKWTRTRRARCGGILILSSLST